VVKPTIHQGFNYKALQWADLPSAPDDGASLAPQPADENAGAVPA